MAAQDLSIYQADAQIGDLKLWRVPEEVLSEAQQAATALKKRIAGKEHPVKFNGEQYVENDDWQMLSNFFGYSPKITGTEFVEYGEIKGFKAIAELINEHTGAVVGRGEAMCLDEEENWGPRAKYDWQDALDAAGKRIWDPRGGKNGSGGYQRQRVQVGVVNTPLFQLMSMAQTRACNKAMSNKLKWVVSLAGYATTPAEDMHEATLAPKPETAATLPTEIKKKPAAAAPSIQPGSAWSAAQSSGTASPRMTVPVAPQRGADAERTPSSAPPAEHRTVLSQAARAAGVRINEAQSRRFFAKWRSSGKTREEVNAYLRSIGVANDKEIPADRYDLACAWADMRR